jgi:hypothetical protein
MEMYSERTTPPAFLCRAGGIPRLQASPEKKNHYLDDT